jgi:hypothetical protein
MTTAAGTYFVLENGAKAENVLFALESAATLGANSILEGSLIVGTSAAVGIGAQVNGCIIALADVTYSGRGGTTGDSALAFDDAGTGLEHCAEVTSSPTSSPTSVPSVQPISFGQTPTSSRGDPHCKYQRFYVILLAYRSFILLSCHFFDLQSGPGRMSTLNTTDSAT